MVIRMLNENKVCFIMCVNDEFYEKESRRYIQNIIVPEGFEIEMQSVRGAASMAGGYQYAMQQSDAKYKVYLHQDVFLINRNLIYDMLQTFSDETVGMIGLIGSPKLSEDAVMWNGERIGRIFASNILETGESITGIAERPYQEVEAIDGLCMMTQYDVPWREDLFQGWDFYDISQTMEFRKRGYKVVVPYVEESWCIHDDGCMNLAEYFSWRDIFVKEYKDML